VRQIDLLSNRNWSGWYWWYSLIYVCNLESLPTTSLSSFTSCLTLPLITTNGQYESCPESIRPFWISREPIAWPWCNLAANQRRPYCTSVNSHCPVGLVSRQWDAVDWACRRCERRNQNHRAIRSTSSRQCAYPFYSSRAGFLAKHHITQLCQTPYSPDLAPCDFRLFPKLKSPLKGSRFVNVHCTRGQSTASHCRLTSPTGERHFTDAQ
jgi:hypothetical protein